MLHLKEELPYYEIEDRFIWGIFYRDYVDWNKDCRGETLEDTVTMANSIDDIQTS